MTGMGVAAVSLAIQAVLTVIGWIRIPPGTRVAIHWGVDFQPNGYASKPVALLLTPLLTLLLSLLIIRPDAPAPGNMPVAVFTYFLLYGVTSAAHALIVFTAISNS